MGSPFTGDRTNRVPGHTEQECLTAVRENVLRFTDELRQWLVAVLTPDSCHLVAP